MAITRLGYHLYVFIHSYFPNSRKQNIQKRFIVKTLLIPCRHFEAPGINLTVNFVQLDEKHSPQSFSKKVAFRALEVS